MSSNKAQPPPRLHFDDGSRIIIENASSPQMHERTNRDNDATIVGDTSSKSGDNPRGSTSVEIYYEIDRIATEIVDHIIIPHEYTIQNHNEDEMVHNTNHDDGFLCKVALQFPDELLNDAAEVSWLIEDAILSTYKTRIGEDNERLNEKDYASPLVFVLGDTTYSSCCPDEIGALHLNADVIVHYGQYACLSPSQCLPVIYSFGVLEWTDIDTCIDMIQQQIDESDVEKRKVLLLCERRYHQYMETLSSKLNKNNKIQEVIIGSVPKHDLIGKSILSCRSSTSCCGVHNKNNEDESVCCGNQSCDTKLSQDDKDSNKLHPTNDNSMSNDIGDDNDLTIGGLQIPIHPRSLSQYTLIYIGDDSGTSRSRQFLNTILRCTSPSIGTHECWSYNPNTNHLSTDPTATLGISRYLNRRFYLTEKAQLSSIMGILVGTLSQDRFQNVIKTVRRKIQDSGRGCYTFVVGKINVAKLANFAEVECFVLISCGETSVLVDERDFHVPVITPSELEIVLGNKAWCGSDSCNTDFNVFLKDNNNDDEVEKNGECNDDHESDKSDESDDDHDNEIDDEPFFSMISGTYVSKPLSRKLKQQEVLDKNNNINLSESQMVEYKSDAAEFWKKREYKGLEAKIGQTEVKAATEGQCGIASDYGK